jgi:hypothetical protein
MQGGLDTGPVIAAELTDSLNAEIQISSLNGPYSDAPGNRASGRRPKSRTTSIN